MASIKKEIGFAGRCIVPLEAFIQTNCFYVSASFHRRHFSCSCPCNSSFNGPRHFVDVFVLESLSSVTNSYIPQTSAYLLLFPFCKYEEMSLSIKMNNIDLCMKLFSITLKMNAQNSHFLGTLTTVLNTQINEYPRRSCLN